MRLEYERISLPEQCSWGFYYNFLENYPFNWHCHPEYELTLTINGRGSRYVGDSISSFSDPDLVLLGPNLPHSWSSERLADPNSPLATYVMWFTHSWVESLGRDFTEFKQILTLFQQSRRGICFSQECSRQVGEIVVEMPDMNPRQRFARILDVLDLILNDQQPVLLSSADFAAGLEPPNIQARLDRALGFINEHYASDLSVPQIADACGMAESSFYRFFKRHMKQSVVSYITGLRIGRACAMLLETDLPISEISCQVGYNNLSNFNRRFRAVKKVSPRDFRKRFEPETFSPPPDYMAADSLKDRYCAVPSVG